MPISVLRLAMLNVHQLVRDCDGFGAGYRQPIFVEDDRIRSGRIGGIVSTEALAHGPFIESRDGVRVGLEVAGAWGSPTIVGSISAMQVGSVLCD